MSLPRSVLTINVRHRKVLGASLGVVPSIRPTEATVGASSSLFLERWTTLAQTLRNNPSESFSLLHLRGSWVSDVNRATASSAVNSGSSKLNKLLHVDLRTVAFVSPRPSPLSVRTTREFVFTCPCTSPIQRTPSTALQNARSTASRFVAENPRIAIAFNRFGSSNSPAIAAAASSYRSIARYSLPG